jgi:hypothetical protein
MWTWNSIYTDWSHLEALNNLRARKKPHKGGAPRRNSALEIKIRANKTGDNGRLGKRLLIDPRFLLLSFVCEMHWRRERERCSIYSRRIYGVPRRLQLFYVISPGAACERRRHLTPDRTSANGRVISAGVADSNKIKEKGRHVFLVRAPNFPSFSLALISLVSLFVKPNTERANSFHSLSLPSAFCTFIVSSPPVHRPGTRPGNEHGFASKLKLSNDRDSLQKNAPDDCFMSFSDRYLCF